MSQILLFIFLTGFGLSQVITGIAVDPNTYTPNHSTNKAVPLVVDKATGRLLTSTTGGGGGGGSGGDASAANQVLGNNSLTSINGKIPTLVSGRIPMDGSGVTQPVSGTFWQSTQPVSLLSVPLASGASTSALQTTGNSSLLSLDGKTATLGQKAMTGSSPVVIASDQSAIPISGSLSVSNFPSSQAVTGTFWQTTQPVSLASVPLPVGASSTALQTTGNSSLASIDGKIATLGQKTMTGSSPVVIASDQSAIPISGSLSVSNFPASQSVTGTFWQTTQPVSLASVPLPTGASTESTLSSLNSKVTTVNTGAVVISSSTLPTGAATSALQTTGNSSLSSLDGKMPTLGQKVMTGSIPIVIASDQSAIPISGSLSVSNFPSSQAVTGIFFQSTQPVSLSSVPLPTGAATSALQISGNSSLTNIDGDLGINVDTSAQTGNGSIIALLKAIRDFKAPSFVNSATITSATETTVIPAVGGIRNVVKYVLVQNQSTSNRVKIDIRGATAGAILFSFELPANTGSTTSLFSISVANGVAQPAANSNWTITATGTSPNVFVSMSSSQITY